MTHALTKNLSHLLTTTALVFLTAACSSRPENRNYTASSGIPQSYVENALSDQSDLTMFYQALLTTGVAKELNNNTEYTIFAPTNTAFSQIKRRSYPCFYAVQCRPQMAAILRNHIVPRNESVNRFSRWGGNIATLGNRRIDVEEPYKGHYTVEGYRVLYQNETNKSSHVKGNNVSLYRIDGLIASNLEMAPFKSAPMANIPETLVEKTVTTYHAPPRTSYTQQMTIPNEYTLPSGYTHNPVFYTDEYDDLSDTMTETTTVTTHTTTNN